MTGVEFEVADNPKGLRAANVKRTYDVRDTDGSTGSGGRQGDLQQARGRSSSMPAAATKDCARERAALLSRAKRPTGNARPIGHSEPAEGRN